MAEATLTLNFTIADPEKDGEKDPTTGEISKSISAEVNADDNIGADGKGTTEAKYGVPIVFRVYTMPPGLGYTITTSDGSASPSSGNGLGSTAEVEDKITFAGKNEATTSKPIVGEKLTGYQWFGNDLGAIGAKGNNVIFTAKTGVAVAKVKYRTEFQKHTFTLPNRGIDDYEVVIYIASTDDSESENC